MSEVNQDLAYLRCGSPADPESPIELIISVEGFTLSAELNRIQLLNLIRDGADILWQRDGK